MKTEINKFWNRFLAIQIDLIISAKVSDIKLLDKLINELLSNAVEIHSHLRIIISLLPKDDNPSKLIFLTKGDYKLEALIREVVGDAPQLPKWEYQIGVKPYKGSIINLCAASDFLGDNTTIFQIYFAIHKVYKTSNKLHLIIFFDVDKKHSKYALHEAMENIFTWFLGDAFYHSHISKYKIVRRKYASIHFTPLDELKNVIQYKNLN